MKLVIKNCKVCSNKITLDITASSKSELRQKLGGELFYAQCNNCSSREHYKVNDVVAGGEAGNSLAGGVIGGLIGLLGGPIGMLIVGGIGAGIGNSIDSDDKKNIDFFNESR